MLRSAVAYIILFLAFLGVLIVIHAHVTPAVALLPLIVWPDMALLTGLGRMDRRTAWACRILGLGGLLWTYALKFIGT